MSNQIANELEKLNKKEIDTLEDYLTEELEMAISKKYYLVKQKDESLDEAIESTFLSIHDCDLPTTIREMKENINQVSDGASVYKVTIKVEKVKK